MITVAVLCGGPSLERGISLNSARSVLDHLASKAVDVVPIYIDARRRAYKVSKAQLYSNTPSDFDFKLQQAGELLNRSQLIALLKSVDLTFPVMHGAFAEDGEIQRLLEKHRIPFVGSGSAACMACFDKFNSNQFIRERGFATLPSALLERGVGDHAALIRAFFKQHQIKRAVVKPASGGSSIGVFSVGSPEEALAKAEFLFAQRMDSRVVLEQFAQGFEFTVIILQNRFGLPVALPPTEIETSYDQHQIFDFRKKYLPTRQVIWHCPPRFADEVIEKIQAQAEQLFAAFGMRDFARFDGWVLPDGRIWFCDFNPISGMEQNSFLFQQGARIGLTHADTLRHVVGSACRRYGITLPELPVAHTEARQPVQVLFGGNSSEREVSLMSGSNVWLKLRKSERFAPQAFVLDGTRVWHVPYHLVLNHTVEEVIDNCKHYPQAKQRLEHFENRVRIRLGMLSAKNANDFFAPTVMSLQQFVQQAPFVFIGLHGGKGEDGTLQALLQQYKVPHNGSSARVSRLCMDKWATSQFIAKLNIPGVLPIAGQVIATRVLLAEGLDALQARWQALQQALGSTTIVVKPRADGCSSGVVRLNEWQDLQRYVECIAKGMVSIPAGTFSKQRDPIEMPPHTPSYLLFERYVATDLLRVQANRLKYVQKTGWLEVTMGVMTVNGQLHGLNPSITVAEGEVLTVEEKFQGGTGVNITPPPSELIKPAILKLIKERIVAVASQVGIEGYARIDAFVNLKTGEVMIIEINTLPGLTPSTVFFHQGLAEHPQLYPTQLLERLVENKLSRA